MIKRFPDYPTVQEPSAFIQYSGMKALNDLSIKNTVLDLMSTR